MLERIFTQEIGIAVIGLIVCIRMLVVIHKNCAYDDHAEIVENNQ